MDWLSVGLIPVVHELGHWLAARLFGASLVFSSSWGTLGILKVPRWTWMWPQGVTERQLKAICQAGFVAEIALMPLMPWQYNAAVVLHFLAYPWYAGTNNDFTVF